MATRQALNVIQVDDKNGSHYRIFEVAHITGTVSTVDVDDSCIGAAEVPPDGATAVTVTVANTSETDYTKEVTIASGSATATYTIIARFGGTAGAGSGHGDL